MKVKQAIPIILTMLCLHGFGQNLVPNWSFEDTVYCPFLNGQFDAINPWTSLNNSSDYFNSCASPSIVGVPTNFAGNQFAYDGQAYVGQNLYNPIGINNREYVSIRLSEPLDSGTEYYVSFMVSCSELSMYAVSTYGAFFSHDTIFTYDNSLIDTLPQVENDPGNVISEQDNWVQIQGSFIAGGGEEFITLGNFRQDSITALDTIVLSGASHAYYYVDAVQVTENTCSQDTQFVSIPNVFTPNDDGVNDFFRVSLEGYEFGVVIMYNRWGQKIYEFNPVRGHWDGYTQAGVQVPEGVYFYSLSCLAKDAEPFVTKGSIQLIR